MIKKRGIDIGFLLAVLFLIVFGVVMVSSVSVYESNQLTQSFVNKGIDGWETPVNDFYLWRHVFRVMISLPLLFLASRIPYHFWRKMALPLFGISIFLLVLVLIPQFSNDYGSAKSWLNLPLLPRFQPSEVAKLALIFYLAIWMDKKVQAIKSFQEGFLPFVVLLSVFVLLIGLQPDFGAILVIACISASIFFVAGGNILHIIGGGMSSFLLAWPIVLSHEYIKKRLLLFLDPSLDPQGAGYQIKQALMTIGSGEWWGVGFGKSIQKFGYLPEVQGDTIFAVAAEELGFIRIALLLFVFLFLAWRGYLIAMNAPDRFSTLLATGCTSWIFFQAIINMGVTMAVLPLTGITLPFISYGGSSLFTMSIAAGILLNISMYAQKEMSFRVQWRGLWRPHRSIARYR
ncbi:stage V sporulation protein E [Candidatus Peregrinibacteria bacterium]|nr:MAG: stage V sporulation protein E [Candidatus Peregrinibacteria bacterium]